VRTYSVVEQSQDATTKAWTVTVDVTVAEFDADKPREEGLPTLAVLELAAGAPAYALAGRTLPGPEARQLLLRRMKEQFVKDGRFRVLERGSFAVIQDELDRIGTTNFSLEERVKLGNQLGADYLVTGSLEELRWDVHERPLVTGGVSRTVDARFGLSLDLLNVGSGQVLWSGRVAGKVDRDDLAALGESDLDRTPADFLLDRAANAAVVSLVESVYPVKVIKAETRNVAVDGGTRAETWVWISAGGVRARPGEQFRVYSEGEELVDPDTGISLGSERVLLATIEVAEVQDKYSKARVVDGDGASLERGAVCERVLPD
jgi:curli biogenesis system outer membrane secretion channel CsgG